MTRRDFFEGGWTNDRAGRTERSALHRGDLSRPYGSFVARALVPAAQLTPPLSEYIARSTTICAGVAPAADFPETIGKRFGMLVESIGATPAQIVVERAMYSDSGGVNWAAGTNALATKLP